MDITKFQEKTDQELLEMARELGLFENGSRPRRQTLLNRLLQNIAEQNGTNLLASGILSVTNEGYGFLKPKGRAPGVNDVYVSPVPDPKVRPPLRRRGLRSGQTPKGQRAILRTHSRRYRQ